MEPRPPVQDATLPTWRLARRRTWRGLSITYLAQVPNHGGEDGGEDPWRCSWCMCCMKNGTKRVSSEEVKLLKRLHLILYLAPNHGTLEGKLTEDGTDLRADMGDISGRGDYRGNNPKEGSM